MEDNYMNQEIIAKPVPRDVLAAHDMIKELLAVKVSKDQISRRMEMSRASICKILNKENIFISYQKFRKLLGLYCQDVVLAKSSFNISSKWRFGRI